MFCHSTCKLTFHSQSKIINDGCDVTIQINPILLFYKMEMKFENFVKFLLMATSKSDKVK